MDKPNKEKTPFISVIMNCHNSEKYLREAINSVYNQTYKNWEIIFWDNYSSDNSALIASQYDENLKYFKSNKFTSLYTARNSAINQSNGDIIAFLDCDDIWLPDKLMRQVAVLSDEYPLIYGGYEIIDQSGNTKGIVENAIHTGLITNFLLKKNSISIGCVLIKSNLIKEYKFDPYYELLGDYDLWIRLSKNSKFLALDGILEYCRYHGENISEIKKDLWLKERRYFYLKFLKSQFKLQYFFIFQYILKTEIKGIFMFLRKLKLNFKKLN